MIETYGTGVRPAEAFLMLTQDGDCCGGEDHHFLTIHTEDGGGGGYLVLKTDRWALDPEDIKDFCAFLTRFAADYCTPGDGFPVC